MFGLGFGEVLLILGVALIVIGPKKLPEVARALGRALGELRRMGDDVQRTIQREIHSPLRDDVLKDLSAARAQVKPGPPPAESGYPAPPPSSEPPAGEVARAEPESPDSAEPGASSPVERDG